MKVAKKIKQTYQKLRDICDALWQRIILDGDPKCFSCGKPATVGHHYIPKSLSAALRYDIKNGIPLCQGCHLAIHKNYDPEINNRIVFKLGQEWLDYINFRRRVVVSGTNTARYYKEIYERLSK